MPTVKAIFLKGRRNTREYRVWSKWIDQAALLANRYSSEIDGDDPFAYNETASVSVLASAAACAGFVALAEFSTDKAAARATGSRNRNTRRKGRSDLWMYHNGKSWAFEFKQFNHAGAASATGRLKRYMDLAESCAGEILKKDADCVVAGLIWPLYWIARNGDKATLPKRIKRAEDRLTEFIAGCDYAWKIEGFDSSPPTYVMFKVVKDYC